LPVMFTVASQPLRRQRHVVTSEMPAIWVNVRKLSMGLPVSGANGVVFTPGDYGVLRQRSGRHRVA
jgi:hypothetical protein